jgi:hypothetical protein
MVIGEIYSSLQQRDYAADTKRMVYLLRDNRNAMFLL